jgi:hypothetical protein
VLYRGVVVIKRLIARARSRASAASWDKAADLIARTTYNKWVLRSAPWCWGNGWKGAWHWTRRAGSGPPVFPAPAPAFVRSAVWCARVPVAV